LCHLQHKLIGFYNRDEKCLQRGTDWVFKYSSLPFIFKGLIPGFVPVLQFTEPPVTDPKPVNLFVTPTQPLAVNQILHSMLGKLRHIQMTRKIIVNMFCA